MIENQRAVEPSQIEQIVRSTQRFRGRVEQIVDMPDDTLDLLFRFLKQNDGRLSKRARAGECSALEPTVVEDVEAIYTDIFGRHADGE